MSIKSKLFAFGLFCGALLSPSLGLDAVWQPQTTVSEPAFITDGFQSNALAVNFQGNAIAVWPSEDSPISGEAAIMSSFYTRGVGWGPNIYVSSLATYAPDRYIYTEQGDPDVDMNSSNYAVAVWEGSYNLDPFFMNPILGASRLPDGTFGPVQVVSGFDDDVNAVNPSVQINEAGTALAAWRQSRYSDAFTETKVSFLPFGGAWTAPFAISTQEPGNDDDYPRSALNSRGDAVVAWKTVVTGNIRGVNVATYNATTATWAPPVTLDTGVIGDRFTDPVVSIDENGNSVAIWGKTNTNEVKTSYRPFGGVWEPAIILATSIDEAPYVIMDRAGNATAVWGEDSGMIYSATRPFGGVWSLPVVISQGIGNDFDPFQIQDPVAVDLAGDVMAVWENGDGLISSAFKPFGQAWQTPELVSVDAPNGLDNVGLAECGFAVASWLNNDSGEVEAAVHENLLPLIVAGSARYTQCTLKFATQKRVISNLTWDSLYPGCVAAFNIYCNGNLIGTVTDGSFAFTVSDCDNSCRFFVTAVDFAGLESAPIPFVLTN